MFGSSTIYSGDAEVLFRLCRRVQSISEVVIESQADLSDSSSTPIQARRGGSTSSGNSIDSIFHQQALKWQALEQGRVALGSKKAVSSLREYIVEQTGIRLTLPELSHLLERLPSETESSMQ